MTVELAIKSQINNLLDNPFITGLIRDKFYNVDENTSVSLEGNLNFSLRMDGERLVLDILDVRPQISAKRGFILKVKLKGRISSISIGRKDIILAIEGLPDQTIAIT